MKILKREFSKSENALIVLFAIILLALCYYRFVYIPITDAIEEAQNLQYNLLDEETVVQAKAMKLKKMADEVAELKAQGVTSTQLSYNGHKQEVAFLNDVLTGTMNYSLRFTSLTRSSDQLRRNFSLSFTCTNYEAAKNVINNLNNSPYRILIDDIRFSKQTTTTGTSIFDRVEAYSQSIDYEVSVSLTGTFYETTVGGTADAGLPAN